MAIEKRSTHSQVVSLLGAGRDHEAARAGVAELIAQLPDSTEGHPMDALTQLAQLGPLVGEVVAGITPDQLALATPCQDFNVRGVLEHMIGGATMFAAAYRGVEATSPDTEDVLAGFGPALGDLAAAMSEPGAMQRNVDAPFGTVPGEQFARFVVLDGLIHGWDLATATGQKYSPSAELVGAVTEFAKQALPPLRDGETFAAATVAAEDATPIEHLAALSGRQVTRSSVS